MKETDRGFPRPALEHTLEAIDEVNRQAPAGKVLSGLWQVLWISKANAIDDAAERHRDTHTD